MKVIRHLHCIVNFKLHVILLGTLISISLDWKKCIICQESMREGLQCPINSNGPPEANQQTYLAFLQNANSFW